MSRNFVVVDLETTGNSFEKGDRIIQISAVAVENNKIVDQYTSFINPGISIPPFIEELTGINDHMVENAPTFSEIAHQVKAFLADSIFVAHNVLFDLSFLQGELRSAGFLTSVDEAIDTVELTKIIMPDLPSYKLADLSEQFEFVHDHPHRADSDALATAELLRLLIENAKQLPLVTLEKLADLSFYLKSDISILLHEIIKEKRRKIEDLPPHLEVFRGIALKKKETPEEAEVTSDPNFPLHHEDKEKLIQTVVNGYEKRVGQMDMMNAVYEAFTTKKHALIEAETGIGKSLGYLFPALYFAMERKEPIIISTYTLQMQDQLNTEIQKMSKIVPFSFRATVLKGRHNYLNLLKFEQSLNEVDPVYDHVMTKMQLLVWLTKTDTGDIDELNFSSGGKRYKERIRHDGWFLQKEKDPWISRDFYMHARKLALHAEIVITNHAMLLVDMEKEKGLLPEANFIIVDEAHNFIQAARKSYGKKIEFHSVKYILGKLGTLENRQMFSRFEQMIQQKGLETTIYPGQLDQYISQFDAEIDDFFMLLSRLIVKETNHMKQAVKLQIRITERIKEDRLWSALTMCAERLLDLQRQIYNGLHERLQKMKEQSKIESREKALIEEMNSFLLEWDSLGENWKELMIKASTNDVVWVEGDARTMPNSLSLYSQPVNVGDLLSDHFFAKKASVVMTSATMTIDQSFQYFLQQLHLESAAVIQMQIRSPFAYEKLAKLLIPTDLPQIRAGDNDEFIEAVAGHLAAIAEATEGRMLVLFTSHDMLRKTYQLVKESGLLEEFVLLAQGITAGSRTRLTKNFQQFDKAILFGTNSFWEGVDIPGKDLACLVIVRLPFSSPQDPLTAAKFEEIKKIGKNPFSVSSLPEAVIRFKQGFGRLIRTETDRGVVIVLDRRIDTTTYGKAFLQSLPKIPIERGGLKEIISIIDKWL
ncbi:ATP-dependent DNA helicase DinG [Bacillus sp. FJAT-50079]|uniref:ATP-dependent DNA helicase DinG n=1 Tax=Bacillus sp. FJAT-50079 TaxID=2833577 RepID=UPI001BCA247C|nr:ATP-dependent DNA helicase DinG [Bacillus sp. FJAT-50079]MBS4209790.1 ATP-dependent DNA helicase DinG [Bacillus sp. FJAT-50079]